MKDIQDLVCLILNQALFHSKTEYDYSQVPADTWEKVYEEFCNHVILSIPADVIQQLPMPAELLAQWESDICLSPIHFFTMANQQNDILVHLREAKVPFAVLKGMSAARYYPYPWLRMCGDIDLIVSPEHFEKAKETLLFVGYNLEETDEEQEDSRHLHLEKNEIRIELHRYFAGKESSEGFDSLDDIIFENIKSCELAHINQYEFPVLPEIVNGLVLLKHIQQHLQTGLGLRQILDWLMYARENLTDQSWEEFRKVSDRIGLTGLAIYVTRMGQIYLGFPEENYSWCKEAEADVCNSLLNYVFQSGDFGHKQEDSSIMIGAMTRMRENFFQSLQASGEKNWELLKKYPFLKPLAWLYQIFRYIKRGLLNRDGIAAIYNSNRTSHDLQEMMKTMNQWGR